MRGSAGAWTPGNLGASKRWEPVNAEFGAMGPILLDPWRQNTLYLAAMNSSFQRSTDGGETWQRPGTIPGEMVMSSSLDKENPDTFYAAGGAVFKSTNGDRNWHLWRRSSRPRLGGGGHSEQPADGLRGRARVNRSDRVPQRGRRRELAGMQLA
jgi:hypothetical protein